MLSPPMAPPTAPRPAPVTSEPSDIDPTILNADARPGANPDAGAGANGRATPASGALGELKNELNKIREMMQLLHDQYAHMEGNAAPAAPESPQPLGPPPPPAARPPAECDRLAAHRNQELRQRLLQDERQRARGGAAPLRASPRDAAVASAKGNLQEILTRYGRSSQDTECIAASSDIRAAPHVMHDTVQAARPTEPSTACLQRSSGFL